MCATIGVVLMSTLKMSEGTRDSIHRALVSSDNIDRERSLARVGKPLGELYVRLQGHLERCRPCEAPPMFTILGTPNPVFIQSINGRLIFDPTKLAEAAPPFAPVLVHNAKPTNGEQSLRSHGYQTTPYANYQYAKIPQETPWAIDLIYTSGYMSDSEAPESMYLMTDGIEHLALPPLALEPGQAVDPDWLASIVTDCGFSITSARRTSQGRFSDVRFSAVRYTLDLELPDDEASDIIAAGTDCVAKLGSVSRGDSELTALLVPMLMSYSTVNSLVKAVPQLFHLLPLDIQEKLRATPAKRKTDTPTPTPSSETLETLRSLATLKTFT